MDRKLSKHVSTEYIVRVGTYELCTEETAQEAETVARHWSSTTGSVSTVLVRDTYEVDTEYKTFGLATINGKQIPQST